jgi:hypothetical protein
MRRMQLIASGQMTCFWHVGRTEIQERSRLTNSNLGAVTSGAMATTTFLEAVLFAVA